MPAERRKSGDVLIVVPQEQRIDASSAKAFKGEMVDWINEGHHKIVLDLQHVNFIDSSGLGAIVSCLKSLGDQGALVLCNIGGAVSSLFELTRMDRKFKIFRSQEEAVAALSKLASV